MTENNLPTHIDLGSKSCTFIEIHTLFSRTDWGKTLKSCDRYSTYKPEGVSSYDWKKALGPDVNNLDHLPVSLGLTREFLRHCHAPQNGWKGEVPPEAQFTHGEQEHILFTSISHDWAEAVIGDIALPLKTENDEKEEMIILRQQMQAILGDSLGAHNYDVLASTVENILTRKDEKLGRAFNAIERVGYTRTGIRAYLAAPTASECMSESLMRLGLEVTSSSIPHLVDYAKTFPPVDAFLCGRKMVISEIIDQVDSYAGVIPINSRVLDNLPEIKEKWFGQYIGNTSS